MRGFRKYDLVQTVFLPGRHVCNTLVCYNIIRTVAPFGPAAMKENTPPDGGKHSVVKHVVFLLIVLALACAAAMATAPQRPRDLKPTCPDAQKILHRNVYGWFERSERGVYKLTATGRSAVAAWGPSPLSGTAEHDRPPAALR